VNEEKGKEAEDMRKKDKQENKEDRKRAYVKPSEEVEVLQAFLTEVGT